MNLTFPNQYDFFPRFFRLAIINVLSNIILPLSGLIGVAFLGHLDQLDYLAGVALYGTLFSYIYTVFSFLRMATTGPTAQAVGRDDPEEMVLVGLRNGLIALAISLIVLALQYPLQLLWYNITSASLEVKASGIAYFNTRIWGAPAVLLNSVLVGWFLGREMSSKVLLLSFVGNTANILLDYLLIVHWDRRSAGAGIAQAASQYLMLFLSLMLVGQGIQWQAVKESIKKLGNISAFQATFTLNSNFFIRALATVSTFAVFTNLSSTMGTVVLIENSLFLRMAILSFFIVEGIGYATQTLAGNFSSQDDQKRLLPLVQIALVTSLLMGLGIAVISVLFPQTIFGLLTNSDAVTQQIQSYVPWLFLLLGFNSISQILDGYFAGLGKGKYLRNAAIAGALIGFLPLAGGAWYWQNNHLLLLALSLFMVVKATYLMGVAMLENFESKLPVLPEKVVAKE